MTIFVNLELSARNAVNGVKRGDIIVVIDVLRCSSTIITALANGAAGIIPMDTVKKTLEFRKRYPEHILAGERGGLKPKGFDLGNSPLEFTPDKVAGKHIVLTTTSGTLALIRSEGGRMVFVGAFLNVGALAEKILEIAREKNINITLVSSGRRGNFSLEDFICAGAIAENLDDEGVEVSDAALSAVLAFRQARDRLYENICKGEHARYLISLGLRRDVKFCSRLDYYQIVPAYRNGIIMPFG